MKTKGNINLAGNQIRNLSFSDSGFPENPRAGQIIFKDKRMMACVSTNPPAWASLTDEINTHVHKQLSLSTGFTITHGLNTSDVVLTAIGLDGKYVMPDDVTYALNSVTLSFSTHFRGHVVLMCGSVSGVPLPSQEIIVEPLPEAWWDLDSIVVVDASYPSSSVSGSPVTMSPAGGTFHGTAAYDDAKTHPRSPLTIAVAKGASNQGNENGLLFNRAFVPKMNETSFTLEATMYLSGLTDGQAHVYSGRDSRSNLNNSVVLSLFSSTKIRIYTNGAWGEFTLSTALPTLKWFDLEWAYHYDSATANCLHVVKINGVVSCVAKHKLGVYTVNDIEGCTFYGTGDFYLDRYALKPSAAPAHVWWDEDAEVAIDSQETVAGSTDVATRLAGNSVAALNGAVVSNGQYKFSANSIVLGSAGSAVLEFGRYRKGATQPLFRSGAPTTLEMWAYTTGNITLLTVRTGSVLTNRLTIASESGVFKIWHNAQSPVAAFTAGPVVNQWAHYAITHDGSGQWKLFINGVLLSTVQMNLQSYSYPGDYNGQTEGPVAYSGSNNYYDRVQATQTVKYTGNFTPPQYELTQTRYIVEVQGIRGGGSIGNCAALNELALLTSDGVTVPYSTTVSDYFDNAKNGVHSYWNYGLWGRSNLNDGAMLYNQSNSTIFNYDDIGSNLPEGSTTLWSRFLINANRVASCVKVYFPNNERAPHGIKVYRVTGEYDKAQHLDARSNEGLAEAFSYTRLSDLTFGTVEGKLRA